MVKKYKAALIGTGRIGFLLQFDKKREQPASHSSALYSNKRICLACASDTDDANLRKWKRFYKDARIYRKPEDLFENERPEIVVIAVNEKSHLEIFRTAVKYKPMLIILEKPAAPDLKQARLIHKESLRNKIPVMINHERRFSADYVMARELIVKKSLGNIQSIKAVFSSNIRVYKDGSEKDGSCSLIHDGTHLMDILIFLTGASFLNPSILRMVKDRKNEVRILDVTFLEKIKSGGENGTLFHIEFNGERKYFGFDIEINGSTGKLLIGNGYFKFYESKESPYYKGFHSLVRNEKMVRPDKTGYFSGMIKNCVDYLDGRTGLRVPTPPHMKKASLVSPLSEGIKTLEIIFRIISKIKRMK